MPSQHSFPLTGREGESVSPPPHTPHDAARHKNVGIFFFLHAKPVNVECMWPGFSAVSRSKGRGRDRDKGNYAKPIYITCHRQTFSFFWGGVYKFSQKNEHRKKQSTGHLPKALGQCLVKACSWLLPPHLIALLRSSTLSLRLG